MTALVWSEELLKYDFGSYHPLRSERCKLGVEEILSSEKSALIDVVEPRYATEDELELFHTKKYIESVEANIGILLLVQSVFEGTDVSLKNPCVP